MTSAPEDAVRDADVVYTDTWVSMGQEAEADVRRRAFAGFQVTERLLQCARHDAVFMHCRPAHRGEEVEAAVIDSPARSCSGRLGIACIPKRHYSSPSWAAAPPAMGYSDQQVRDLEATIDRVPCDVVVVGTPIDLSRLVRIRKPVVRARYELQEIGQPDLAYVVDDFLGRLSIPAPGCTKHGKVMAIADGDAEC